MSDVVAVSNIIHSTFFHNHFSRIGNPTTFLTSSSFPAWIIDSGDSDHMIGNKGIVFSLDSTCSFRSVTLVAGFTSSVQGKVLLL